MKHFVSKGLPRLLRLLILPLFVLIIHGACDSRDADPGVEEVRQARIRWIELNRLSKYSLSDVAADPERAISNYITAYLKEDSEASRFILNQDEFLTAFWANQPDARIMDLGKSPLKAFEIEDLDRRFAREALRVKLKGAQDCAIRGIAKSGQEPSGSVIFHIIESVTLFCEPIGEVSITQIAVVLEHNKKFKVASLRPR